jgi:triosephosphate isomerase
MRTPLIAGNWKLHTTPTEAVAWFDAFRAALAGHAVDRIELALGVPATHLTALAPLAAQAGVALAGQDLSRHDEGAHTGEIAGAMLADAGATYVIVGHSERRSDHGESDDVVRAKVAAARRAGLTPILCVGESETDRDAGRAEAVVLDQLHAALEGLEADADAAALVVAYEPVWAIGTGRTATAQDAQTMSGAIRAALRDARPALADGVRILYGGSMKPGNAAELLAQPDVDGGLVGGASLDADAWLAIADAGQAAA